MRDLEWERHLIMNVSPEPAHIWQQLEKRVSNLKPIDLTSLMDDTNKIPSFEEVMQELNK